VSVWGNICVAALISEVSTALTRCLCIGSKFHIGGHPSESGPPAHLTGGQFRNPVGTPPPQEEVSKWVKKQTDANWTTLGWNHFDPHIDADLNSFFFFCGVTGSFVITIFLFAYSPRQICMDWSVREAYLLLREREEAGIEPICKDFVDPEKMLASLPSDEELKAAGVVINI